MDVGKPKKARTRAKRQHSCEFKVSLTVTRTIRGYTAEAVKAQVENAFDWWGYEVRRLRVEKKS